VQSGIFLLFKNALKQILMWWSGDFDTIHYPQASKFGIKP